MYYRFITVLIILVLNSYSFIGLKTSEAQPLWFDRNYDAGLLLEILKPEFEGEDDLTFLTSAWFLSGRFRTNEKLCWSFEIPYTHYGFSSEWDDQKDDALGNPYIGVELGGLSSPVFGEIGFRVPLAPAIYDAATSAGQFADYVDRTEAFLPDILSVQALINHYKRKPSGFSTRVRGGVINWIAIGERDESEMFLVYSAHAGYESPKVSILAGISGRYFLTGDDLDVYEATIHRISVETGIQLGKTRPGIHFRLPVDDDLKNIIDYVIGFSVSVGLN